MKSKITYVSKINIWAFLILILGIIWCIVMLTVFTFHDFIFPEKKIEDGLIFYIIIIPFFSLLAVFCLRQVLRTNTIFVTRHSIIFKNIWTKKIFELPKKDIINYSILKKRNDFKGDVNSVSWTEIILKTQKKEYKITSLEYRDFDQLTRRIKSKLIENKHAQRNFIKKSNKQAGYISLIISLIIIVLAIYFKDEITFKEYRNTILLAFVILGLGFYSLLKK